MSQTLYYIHDPMCSWCYAFGPVWRQVQQALPPEVQVVRLLGGLAADNDQPMEEAMAQRIEATWRRIEERVPGIRFNFDFWRLCTPYRSTWQACRAVIAASCQGAHYEERMNAAIQQAYYRQARNPSLTKTLLELAAELGLDAERFAEDLVSTQTEQELQRQIALAADLGAEGFPSLFLEVDGSRWPLPIDYNHPEPLLETLAFLLPQG